MTSHPLDKDVLEHHVQKAVVEYLTVAGWHVWRIGQRNAKGTQDPGVPDVIAMHFLHGAIWIECKRPVGGRQSRYQREFEASVKNTGGRYILARSLGDLVAALAQPGRRQ